MHFFLRSFYLVVIVAFYSCCYDSPCNISDENHVYFVGFGDRDLSDIDVSVTYTSDSSLFMHKSSLVATYDRIIENDSVFVLDLGVGISEIFEYQITLNTTGQAYRLSDIKYENIVCSKCIWGDNYRSELVRYSVDDTTLYQRKVRIYK